MVHLSIIIINYKTPHLTIDCLRTVFRFPTTVSFEVIVVDNASGDNSKEIILSQFPQVGWIQMTYNAGFARANNEAIRRSKGEVVLLLNSDTLNEHNAIFDCYESFRASEYIACGVQLLNPDHTPQISGNYFMTGGLNNLLPLPYIGNLLKWLGNAVKVKKPNVPNTSEVVEVDWINGAFLMAKRSAIEKVGLMDEDFFLYAEEAEWCARLRKAGRLCIYGQFNVIHLQGATANESFNSDASGYSNLYDRKGFQIMLSNFVRIRKQFGVPWFILHLLVYTFSIPFIFLLSILESIISLRSPVPFMGKMVGLSRNIFRTWTYAALILRNRPNFYKVL